MRSHVVARPDDFHLADACVGQTPTTQEKPTGWRFVAACAAMWGLALAIACSGVALLQWIVS